MAERYVEKMFLNSEESASTGSIVCFDGEHQWNKEKDPRKESWVEVADCHVKARLHRCYEDTAEDYLTKIKKMRDVLNRYIDHLEKVRSINI